MDDLEDAEVKSEEEPEAVEELQEVPSSGGRTWLMVGLVGLIMLIAGILLGYIGRGEFGPEAQAAKATSAAQAVLAQTQAAANANLMEYLAQNTRHFKGDPNAAVTIIEFSDFQCPYCGVFAKSTAGMIDNNYVDSGDVRFGYWNFAFLGEESQWAAEAAECASDQDKYWEYHDKLFSSQNGENQGAFSKENLKKFAAEIGLDSGQFNECLDSGKHAELIQSDTALAQQIGVQSTPSFLVNGSPLVGAVPFERFQELIEPSLNK
jgi:protein-disulfide isomerase